MKNNLEFFRHHADSYQHPKFKMLRLKYGWEGEGRFWALNCMIARAENCQLDLSQKYNVATICTDLGLSQQSLESFVDYLLNECSLLKKTPDGKIYTDILAETLENVSHQRAKSRRRMTKLRRTTPEQDSCSGEQDHKGKESKVKESKKYTDRFEKAWEAYGKRGTKMVAFKYWKKYSEEELVAIEEKIPIYVFSTPDKQFRKHFDGWLNPANRIWENEITLSPEQEKEMEMLEKEVGEAERAHKQLYGFDFNEDGSHVEMWEKEAEGLGIDVRKYGKWRSDYSDANGRYSEQRPLPEKEYPEV